MTTDEERPEWLDTVTNPWFIVLVFTAGYCYAASLRCYRWLRRDD